MRGFCLSCAGLLLGLLSASGCSKEVKAEFPRPPATAATLPSEASDPAPEPTAQVVAGREPAPAPEPELEVDEPAPPSPPPPAVAAEPAEEPASELPSTQLASTDDEDVDPEVSLKLEQAGSLLSSVAGRELSRGQREQVAAARGFVAQAQRAFDEGDERRALVLVAKGLILAADVERISRP